MPFEGGVASAAPAPSATSADAIARPYPARLHVGLSERFMLATLEVRAQRAIRRSPRPIGCDYAAATAWLPATWTQAATRLGGRMGRTQHASPNVLDSRRCGSRGDLRGRAEPLGKSSY